jgi:hypothetical protein
VVKHVLNTFLLALVVALSAPSAEKQRDWQTGVVLGANESSTFAGVVGRSSTNTNSSATAVYAVYQTVLIAGDKYIYQVQKPLKWRWSKAASLTENAPVRFAVEKKNLFVIDDDGKERQLQITKRILRQPQDVALAPALAVPAKPNPSQAGVESDRFERFRTGGYLNGLGWLVMSSEEKSIFLLGFHDGVRAGISWAFRDKTSNGDPDKLAGEILVHDRPGLDVEDQINGIYKDDANLRIPVTLVYQVVKLELTPEGVRLALERLRKTAGR